MGTQIETARLVLADVRARYPVLSGDWTAELRRDYPAGFVEAEISVHDGWQWLVRAMAEQLIVLGHAFSFDQIKEKYGSMRSYGQAPDEIVDTYEALSEQICERCGEPGRMRDGPWISVRCDAHAGQMECT